MAKTSSSDSSPALLGYLNVFNDREEERRTKMVFLGNGGWSRECQTMFL